MFFLPEPSEPLEVIGYFWCLRECVADGGDFDPCHEQCNQSVNESWGFIETDYGKQHRAVFECALGIGVSESDGGARSACESVCF